MKVRGEAGAPTIPGHLVWRQEPGPTEGAIKGTLRMIYFPQLFRNWSSGEPSSAFLNFPLGSRDRIGSYKV